MFKLEALYEKSGIYAFLQKKYFSVVAFTIYNVFLDLSYIFVMKPGFGSEGFDLRFHPVPILFCFALCILTYCSVSAKDDRFSSMFIEVLLWMFYAPMACFYALSGNNITFFIYTSICFIIIRLVVNINYLAFLKRIRVPRIIGERLHKNAKLAAILMDAGCMAICILISIISFIGIFRFADASNWLVSLNLFRVYEIRMNQADIPGIFSYAFSWQTKVINFFLFFFFLSRKKYILTIIPFILQVVFYLSFSNKSDLFAIVLSLALFVVMKIKNPRQILGSLFCIGTLLVSIAPMISAKGFLLYTFFRRALFIPATLSNTYYDFFSEHALMLFSEGRLGRLLGTSSPYPTYLAKLMMANHTGSMSGGANASFLSSGFADFAFAGMIIASIIFAGILLILDFFSRNLPLDFSLPFLAPCIISLTNSNIFTVLLTYGFILATVLIVLHGGANLVNPPEGGTDLCD